MVSPLFLEASNVGARSSQPSALKTKAPYYSRRRCCRSRRSTHRHRLSKDAAEKVWRRRRDTDAVLLHAADRRFRICAEKGRGCPDDALVVLLRACLRLTRLPQIQLVGEVIPVDDFAAKLLRWRSVIWTGAFDAAPREARATWCGGAKY